MKKLLIIFNVFVSFNAVSQIDTLSNFGVNPQLIINKHQGSNVWGYWTSHNAYGDEAWAEKYYVSGPVKVFGIISHHKGHIANASNTLNFGIRTVASNALPSNLIISKSVRYDEINLSGNAMTTLFNSSVNVNDSFFVSYELGDIAHGGFEGDTIALMMGIEGSRPQTDANTIARNAIRWHSHSGEVWKDFATQNFTNIMTHFAIFPIVEFLNVSNGAFIQKNETKIYPAFPNPSNGKIAINVENITQSEVLFELMSLDGKKLFSSKKVESFEGIRNFEFDFQQFSKGYYILLIKTNKTAFAQKIQIL